MGVDMATENELIAHNFSVAEIGRRIEANSLAYISLEGMMRAVGAISATGEAKGYCNACFTGNYPIPLAEEMDKHSLEQAFG